MKLTIEYVKGGTGGSIPGTPAFPYWLATVGDSGRRATGGDPFSALANLVMDQEATLEWIHENARDKPA